jgi:hypothetical protein
MTKRPLSVTIIGWIFILVGAGSLIYHGTHISDDHIILILTLRFVALVSGICILLRQNWARWLAVAWLAYHVYLSIFHQLPELIIHALLLIVIAFFLFRPKATVYFRRVIPPSPHP